MNFKLLLLSLLFVVTSTAQASVKCSFEYPSQVYNDIYIDGREVFISGLHQSIAATASLYSNPAARIWTIMVTPSLFVSLSVESNSKKGVITVTDRGNTKEISCNLEE